MARLAALPFAGFRLWRRTGVLLLAVIVVSGCRPEGGLWPDAARPPEDASGGAARATSDFPSGDGTAESDRVAALLARLTLDEKIGQMTQVEKNSIRPGDIARYSIGSILSGGGGSPSPNTPQAWRDMVEGFQREALSSRVGVPILYGVDAVHGHGNLYGATIFPHQIGLGAAGDPELVRRIGEATAVEMLATGIPWNFGPVLAVPQDVRWGRTYESYGQDPALVGQLGAAFLDGLQSIPADVSPAAGQQLYALATPKHFLGDGGTTFGTSTEVAIQPYLLDQGDMQMDEASVRSLFLAPYQAAVASGAGSVMVSFSSWNGVKMHAQKYWITDVLKGELGFEGFVVSDWGGIDQIDDDYATSVVTAVNAGIDMVMVPYDYRRFIETMKQAVAQGEIPEERIDDAVSRILKVKLDLGLFDHPFADPRLLAAVGSDAHRALARQAVRQSLVLLADPDGFLPIPKDASLVYVAGEGADDIGMQCGGWTIEWQGNTGPIQPGTTILEGIQQGFSDETRVEYRPQGDFEGMAEVGVAVVGERPYAEGVGDAAVLALAEQDLQTLQNLRAHSARVVAIILSGRPLVITDQLDSADVWIAAWLPGTEGAGVADVLFGDDAFTGRLPFPWPRTNDQLPLTEASTAGTPECAAPLFPVGFGAEDARGRPVALPSCP